MDIVSRFESLASSIPDRPALICGNRSVLFKQLRKQALEISLHLKILGVGRGHRCVISSTNSTDTASLILGVWYNGAIPVLVNELSPREHILHAASVTQPRLIVQDNPFSSSITTANEQIPVCSLKQIVQEARAFQNSTLQGVGITNSITTVHDIASVVFTSGSTGMPKGVAQTHHTVFAACNSVNSHLGIRNTDKVLCPVPWSFDYGYGQLLTTIICGITQIIPEKMNAYSICEAVENSRPTIFAGLPSLYGNICKGLSPIKSVDTTPVRLVTSTGAKFHPDLLNAVRDSFPRAELSVNYGLTETYRSASLPPELLEKHSESVGFAVPGVDLVVVRPDNSLAAPDEAGEVVHRGSGVFYGYWGEPDKTKAVLKSDPCWGEGIALPAPNVVYTGDIGWKDSQGLLYIQGRSDRQIKTMGVRVSPDEIESIVRQYSFISDAAVTAQPHDVFGSMIQVAFVVSKNSLFDLKAFKKYCRENMSPYMLPREFHEFETLPRTPSGKTDYVQLGNLLCSNPMP